MASKLLVKDIQKAFFNFKSKNPNLLNYNNNNNNNSINILKNDEILSDLIESNLSDDLLDINPNNDDISNIENILNETKLPILRCYNVSENLNFQDFQDLNNNIQIKLIIKGDF